MLTVLLALLITVGVMTLVGLVMCGVAWLANHTH